MKATKVIGKRINSLDQLVVDTKASVVGRAIGCDTRDEERAVSVNERCAAQTTSDGQTQVTVRIPSDGDSTRNAAISTHR